MCDKISSGNTSGISGNQKPSIREWEIVCCFLNSGILHWNLLAFPFKLEKEGDGMYVFVHLIVALVIIRPIIMIELGVGQLNQTGALRVWGDIVPLFRGIGFASTLVSIYSLGSASFMTSLGAFYMTKSLTHSLLRMNGSLYDAYSATQIKGSSSAGTFYRNVAFPYVTKLDDRISLPHSHLCVCMAVIWIGICVLHLKFTKLLPMLTTVLCIVPYLIICFLLFISLWNGAIPVINGLKLPSLRVLGVPKKKLEDLKSFLSFGSLLWPNVLPTYLLESLLEQDSDQCVMYIVIFPRFLTERLVGIFFYTILQQLANQTGVLPELLHKIGPVLLFVRIPDYISNLNSVPQIYTTLYFTLILTMCTSRMLMLFRGIQGTLLELLEVHPYISEALSFVLVCVIGYLIGLPFLTHHGKMISHLVLCGINAMKVALAFLQIIGIYVYKWDNFGFDMEFVIQSKFSTLTKLSWKVLLPPTLASVVWRVWMSTEFFLYNRSPIPLWGVGTEFIIFVLVVLCLILPGLYELQNILRYSSDKSILKVYKQILKSKEAWGPKNQRLRQEWKVHKDSVLLNGRSNSLRLKLELLGVTSE